MTATLSYSSGSGRLHSELVGALPLINHFWARLELGQLLAHHLPGEDDRIKLQPAKVLGVLIRNLVISREPVYGLREWAAEFSPELFGLGPQQVELLNDDRVGRALELLFGSDRATLLTKLVVGAVRSFDIRVSRAHNDSTTITFHGSYRESGQGRPRTSLVTHGHNKDHRPDLKQLLWILTIGDDGALPLSYRVADGNTNDEQTHIETWESLARLLGRKDFLYVADCKLATCTQMEHIDRRRGLFLSVLPRSRREDSHFRKWIAEDHDSRWLAIHCQEGRRKGDPPDVWYALAEELTTAEGYRLIWIRSSAKRLRDATIRQEQVRNGLLAVAAVRDRVHSPRSRFHTKEKVEEACRDALARARASSFINVTVVETIHQLRRQVGTGRPGRYTRYRIVESSTFEVEVSANVELIEAEAASDGCFPLVTNERSLDAAALLAAYKYQPQLEKRHSYLKSVLEVTPIWLKSPARVEGLLCCYFVALFLHALIERQLRAAMRQETPTQTLPIYPEQRPCAAPTTEQILRVFSTLQRHWLRREDGIEVFLPEFNDLQLRILDLLGVPRAGWLASQGP